MVVGLTVYEDGLCSNDEAPSYLRILENTLNLYNCFGPNLTLQFLILYIVINKWQSIKCFIHIILSTD